jgi:tetratricopeptide (TPR) repeat protein
MRIMDLVSRANDYAIRQLPRPLNKPQNDMPKTAQQWADAGRRRLSNRNYEGATQAFSKAAAMTDSGENYRFLGYAYKKLGDTDQAIANFSLALDRQSRPEWHTEIARVLRNTGRMEEAERHYKQAWEAKPSRRLALEMGIARWSPGLIHVAADSSPSEKTIILALQDATLNKQSSTDQEELALIDKLAGSDQAVSFWLYVYGRSMCIGHALSALKAKRIAANKLAEYALSNPPDSPEELNDALAAACYVQRYDEATTILARFRESHELVRAWTLHRCAIDLLECQGKLAEARARFQNVDLPEPTRNFRSLLADRSCALVSPAENDLNNGETIDSHDWVIRTNYVGNDVILRHQKMLGSRTDIAYYNTPFYESREAQIIETLRASPVKFVVTRLQHVRWKLMLEIPGLNARPWLSYKKEGFIGIGFALRHLLFELVLLANKPIDVYGADFYLGQHPHYSGYFDEGIEVTQSLAKHDPFDTFMLLKTLWNAGAIRPDAVLANILGETLDSFAERMSRRFAMPPTSSG